ncbi:MAG TPA: hypothetical protein VGT79_07060, partial [Xanthomonadaceae bacterium]|nr:hypothetical protein [Xanthomonadaceae bacterium]
TRGSPRWNRLHAPSARPETSPHVPGKPRAGNRPLKQELSHSHYAMVSAGAGRQYRAWLDSGFEMLSEPAR